MELQFHRPTKPQIRNRLLQIAQQEGLKVGACSEALACGSKHCMALTLRARTQVSENAMEALIESCNSDIRLILNTLQVRTNRGVASPLLGFCIAETTCMANVAPNAVRQMRRMNSDTLQFDDIKSTATKDLELGAFNATDKCGNEPCAARGFAKIDTPCACARQADAE
jgi:DNA polymerase III delta prime subunit